MMPDLGQYTATVLSAYGVGVTLIVALTVLSLLQARRSKRQLRDIESRRAKNA